MDNPSVLNLKKTLWINLATLLIVSCTTPSEQNSSTSRALAETEDKEVDYRSIIGKDFFIDDQHSYLGFKIKYFGFSPVRGRFDSFDGTLMYDPENISSLSVSIFVDVSSINTGNKRRDNDLISYDGWFGVADYPMMTFMSKRAIPKSDGGFDLIGEITAKGITLIDTISFEKPTALSEDYAKNFQVDFSGRITLNRKHFGIHGGDFWSSVMENGLTQLSDEVEIELDMHCRRGNYQARYENYDSLDVNKIVLDRIRNESFESGVQLMDSLNSKNAISIGKFSSVGNTLNQWSMYEEAKAIFKKKQKFFPGRPTTLNQLGITDILLGNYASGRKNFEKAFEMDSANPRASEYLRFLDRMDN